MGSRVQGTGFRFWGTGSRLEGTGFKVSGLGLRVTALEYMVQGLGFRVQSSGFRVQGLGFRRLDVQRQYPEKDLIPDSGGGRASPVPEKHLIQIRGVGGPLSFRKTI